MALTRKLLKDILADREDAEDLIDQIIEEHAETIAPLKAELSRLKEENGGKTFEEVHAELESIAAEIERLKTGNADESPWKTRYEKLRGEFDTLRTKEEAKELTREKTKLFREMLLREGVSRHFDLIVRGSGELINSMEIQDGKVRNHEHIAAAIRSEYADFIGTTVVARHRPTRESIMAISDRTERLAAIENNQFLFD